MKKWIEPQVSDLTLKETEENNNWQNGQINGYGHRHRPGCNCPCCKS